VPRKAIHAFAPERSKSTFVVPYFSPFYSPLTPAAFRPLGYKVDVLPPQDKASIEYGLKHVNNDICYPAVLIVGDVIKAFMSGRYDPANTSVILTQTGGQCRASNYVPLIKKALASAGFGNVPIVTVACGDIHPDLGFAMNDRELARRMMLGIIFADPLAQMYLATIAREKEAGTSKALHTKYLSEMEPGIEEADFRYLLRLLERAVADFNNVPILDHPVPKIGVVGEIFAKYNFFANGNIIDWLSSQNVEVVLPTLQSFFTQRFASEDFDQRAYLKRSRIDHIKSKLLGVYVSYHLMQIEWVMRAFRFYREPFNLKELADITGEVVSLANQFGEGWLLTADMIAMLKEGIGNIVCLQPFGCISNHITGKGLERKLKEMFPHLNLLSLDMDAGDSEVNILNRLQFMVMAAREEPKYQEEEEVEFLPSQPSFVERLRTADVVLFDNKYLDFEVEKWKSWVSGLGLLERARKLVNRL
jgi:predicted nucleotide-binding protein (sugar kinase/HSP70/actin superfamily)